jgi:hypothetical protein
MIILNYLFLKMDESIVANVVIACFVALFGATILGAWLVYVGVSDSGIDAIDDDNFGEVSNPKSPVAIHATTESILWRTVNHHNSHNNLLANTAASKVSKAEAKVRSMLHADTKSRGRFAIVGDDDSDIEDANLQECQSDEGADNSSGLKDESAHLEDGDESALVNSNTVIAELEKGGDYEDKVET